MKVKFANRIYEVLFTKELAGLTMYAVEDEPNHIDWLINVEVVDAEKKELKKIEQKPADKVEPKFNVGDKIQYLKGCGTIMTIEKIENDEYIFANNMGHTTIESGNKWHLVDIKEHNHVWSEEDELRIRELEGLVRRVWAIAEHENDKEIIHRMSDLSFFLKTLKPQPKRDWSEEDEDAIGMAIIALEDMYDEDAPNTTYGGYNLPFNKAAERLKSLKPQNKWKPSKEQIIALRWVLNNIPYNKHKEEISGLLDHLKDRVQLQNTWKPSKGQMEALKEVCNEHYNPKGELYSLYEQLKAL